MTSIDDKTLMAFVDGELAGDRAEEVRTRLSSDPTLRERARIFEDTASLLDTSFDPVLREPVPERILRLLQRPASTVEGPASILRRLANRSFDWTSLGPLALAASLLLAVGITGGFLASRVLTSSPPSSVDAVAFLDGSEGWNEGFELTPSGQSFTVVVAPRQATLEVVPLATFLDRRDRFCRAYQRGTARDGDAVRTRGIACRGDEGQWHTLLVVADSVRATEGVEPSSQDGAYQPAAGESDDPLELAIEAHASTSPLDAERETRLIEQGWR